MSTFSGATPRKQASTTTPRKSILSNKQTGVLKVWYEGEDLTPEPMNPQRMERASIAPKGRRSRSQTSYLSIDESPTTNEMRLMQTQSASRFQTELQKQTVLAESALRQTFLSDKSYVDEVVIQPEMKEMMDEVDMLEEDKELENLPPGEDYKVRPVQNHISLVLTETPTMWLLEFPSRTVDKDSKEVKCILEHLPGLFSVEPRARRPQNVMAVVDDQQFCLRWNNFQANITSQFETLRDDEDFTDVTIACEGQQLQAHKIILSACSPLFKELFKSNPCPHPIIFLRDVEAQHIVALMEFMYAGEVNVAQAQLSSFLKTAESLKIRGLTDTSTSVNSQREENMVFLNPQPSSSKTQCSSSFINSKPRLTKAKISSCSSTVTSSQDVNFPPSPGSPPPAKRQCKAERTDFDSHRTRQANVPKDEPMSVNPYALTQTNADNHMQPKMEMPDYLSDDEVREDGSNFNGIGDITELTGGMEIIPQPSNMSAREAPSETFQESAQFRRRRTYDYCLPFSLSACEKAIDDLPADISNRLQDSRQEGEKRNRLVKLGEGIEIYEDQLRSVKWSDYRKLTRGLATILFSPAELATCSVTGQRWSRAGNGERPVKPALDRAKVQAIISYVATRFPMVEISRIKQVLAYKCKENSTAFKMKAVRYNYGDQLKTSENK